MKKRKNRELINPDLEKVKIEEPSGRPDAISYEEVNTLEEGFKDLIATDSRYSLEVDPENRYHFTPKEKDLIKWMIQYKNV